MAKLDRFEKDDFLLEKAIRLACRAHRGQMRKGSNIPYVSHPFAVALKLQQGGFPESWVIAGLLHDTLEDTEVTLSEIREQFGQEIADIVVGCSEPDHRKKPWEARKHHTLEYLRTAPIAVKVVTCADKLHNLQTILFDSESLGEDIWHRFNRDKQMQEWYYRGLVKSLYENLKPEEHFPIFAEFAQLVDSVFNPDF